MEIVSLIPSAPSSWLLFGLVLLLAYAAVVGIYRLYFHPLASYPGPKLAALSSFYEFYYDVILDGKFLFQRRKLHKIYGRRQISVLTISRTTPANLALRNRTNHSHQAQRTPY
jgi:hypothetical protein